MSKSSEVFIFAGFVRGMTSGEYLSRACSAVVGPNFKVRQRTVSNIVMPVDNVNDRSVPVGNCQGFNVFTFQITGTAGTAEYQVHASVDGTQWHQLNILDATSGVFAPSVTLIAPATGLFSVHMGAGTNRLQVRKLMSAAGTGTLYGKLHKTGMTHMALAMPPP